MATATDRQERIESLHGALRRLGIESILFNQAIADRLRVNLTDLTCYNILRQEGAMTAGRLAEAAALTTGAITGVIDRLEKAGLAERAPDPNDRRRVIIQSTAVRTQELNQILQTLMRPMNEFYERSSDDELKRLHEFVSYTVGAVSGARVQLKKEDSEVPPPETGKQFFAAPIGSTKVGRLVFGHGASHILLKSSREQGDLVQAQFDGPQLKVGVEQGVVTMKYGRPTLAEAARYLLGGAKHVAVVTLTGKVPWEIEIRGGLTKLTGDLSALRVTEISVAGGASDIELTLPAPEGAVPIRIAGGAHKVVMHRPEGTTARIQVSGGANALRFDGQQFGSVGGDVVLESGGFKTAENKYDIRFTGGASSLTVGTR